VANYWPRPQTLTDALDQLLAYLTWRDTKAALVMFNRNKSFTAMVKKMGRNGYRASELQAWSDTRDRTRFRYVFASKDDPAREIILNVMAVNVPNPVEHDRGMAELPQGSRDHIHALGVIALGYSAFERGLVTIYAHHCAQQHVPYEFGTSTTRRLTRSPSLRPSGRYSIHTRKSRLP